jgi:hypothetical protein
MTDIYEKVRQAEKVHWSSAGFLRCYVETTSPPVIAYDFGDARLAEAFKYRLEVEGVRVGFASGRPATVLQYCD